jgi:hypothetical protein
VGKRIGGSAFAKRHQLRRDLLVTIGVSKSSFTSADADTPIRRPADTLSLAWARTEHSVDNHAGNRDVKPDWERNSSQAFVLLEPPSQREEKCDKHER